MGIVVGVAEVTLLGISRRSDLTIRRASDVPSSSPSSFSAPAIWPSRRG